MEKIQKFLFSNPVMLWFYLGYVLMLVVFPFHSANELNNITILRFRADYMVHALLFLPWAFLSRGFTVKPVWWLVLGIAFAAGTEGVQYFLPYRTWNVNDLLANCLGITIGFIIWVILKNILK